MENCFKKICFLFLHHLGFCWIFPWVYATLLINLTDQGLDYICSVCLTQHLSRAIINSYFKTGWNKPALLTITVVSQVLKHNHWTNPQNHQEIQGSFSVNFCINLSPCLEPLIYVEQKWSEVAQLCPTLCDPMDSRLHQAPPSMGFSRQEYWSGLPFPSPGNLPNPGIELSSLTL